MTTPIRIAIADDHILVRNGIAQIIDCFGDCAVVAQAENGKKLIDILGTLDALPDVCIIDVSMPVLNGYDTILALKKLYSGMKFLALSMFEQDFAIVNMVKNGANGYLLKSSTPGALLEAIVSIHTNGFYYSKVASESAFKAVMNNKMTELNERDVRTLSLICNDKSYHDIVKTLDISARTLESHVFAITKKLNIHSRAGLVKFAIESGLVPFGKK